MADANDDDELYDEFGNYIGPELDSSSDEDDEDEDEEEQQQQQRPSSSVDAPDDASEVSEGDEAAGAMVVSQGNEEATTADPINAIVLHEDKEHYASAADTYGEDVRTAVLDEDAMDLDTPIVEPVKEKRHTVEDTAASAETQYNYIYQDAFLTSLVSNETTKTRRFVAIIGHLHHGKTALVDSLMEPTLQSGFGPKASLEDQGVRYTDTLKAEQERHLSIKSTPMTMVLSDTRGKSYAISMVDCPGHMNFHDESVATLRLVDGAMLVVDALEGVMMHTELLIQQAVAEGLKIVLYISKLDRLMVELKLPPRDAYYKLLEIIESVNDLIAKASCSRYPPLTPANGTVCFGSALHGYSFTLPSFAQLYADHHDDSLGSNLTSAQFAAKLWGNWYWDPESQKFYASSKDCLARVVDRSFVTLVLAPMYKIYTACLGESEEVTARMLRGLGVLLKKEQLRASARPLLRAAFSKFLEVAGCGIVDTLVKHIPSPQAAANGKIHRCYSGPISPDSAVIQSMLATDSKGPLVAHVTKLYSSPDGSSFDALARIYSGTVAPGQRVKVLGEAYVPNEDDEDCTIATVESVSIPRGRRKTPVTLATAGNWVLLQGIDATISKSATIIGVKEGDEDQADSEDPVHIFSPLKFPFVGGESIVKMALEPLQPAELPKMVEGLRRVSKSYPMVQTRVEESGEHVLFGTGELYMDCVLHDLRHVHADLEVKVSDPVVAFRETVVETSSLKCFGETTNKRNKLTMIAEPLDEGMAERLEAGKVKLDWDKRKLGRFFQSQYGWDLLSSRSVWAFGDSPTRGTNLLMDDTLPSEVDKDVLNSCRSSIVQGFQWATREGPLCEEPVRGTKLKILDVTLADKPIHRGGGQVIPTARRVVHSSILTATPRLMEPIYRLQIQCPGEIVDSIQNVLKRRRGHIVKDRPISGTLLYNVRGFLPVLDSFGFETDLRTFSQGQAMVHSVFDHWAVVPGDPLDKNILLHPLEPSPPQHLARELLLKTRRRKGLSEDVSINKFFDEAMKQHMELNTQEGDVMAM
eukprot:Nitzschia sp. Nitz4//scaffold141_size107518//24707//27903//NITZ4_004269-RA/size107518-augustus-gene-0.80-mRNA-1//1//CDS//3329536267//5824//frame0